MKLQPTILTRYFLIPFLKTDALNRQTAEKLSARNQEIQKLRSLLAKYEAGDSLATELPRRIPLKINQNKTLFNRRSVTPLLSFKSGVNTARIKPSFTQEDHLTAQNIATDSNLHLSLSDRDWAIVLRVLTLTTSSLNLTGIKPKPWAWLTRLTPGSKSARKPH